MKLKKEQLTFYLISLFGILLGIYLSFKSLQASNTKSDTWFLALQVFLGVLLCLVPFVLEKLFKFTASKLLKNLYWVFILFAVFLGTGLSFYSKFYYWDKLLHFSSAMLLVALGFGILSILMPNFKHLTVPTIVVFGFLFAMTMGVFWEFYEYSFDGLLGLNMQRFATSSGKNLVGRAALYDTMWDLITNTIGALLFSIFCYFKAKTDENWLQYLVFTTNKKK